MILPRPMTLIFVSLFLLITPLTSHALTYKWVDSNNKTHYSSIKPETAHFTTLKPPPGPSRSAPAEIQKFKNQQTAERAQVEKNELTQTELNKQKETANISAQNCDIAKNNLAALTNQPRIRQRNQSGQFEVMSPDALQIAILKARSDVEKFCGPKLPS